MYKTEKSTETVTGVWPTFQSHDARALIDWLVGTLGFVENSVHLDGDKISHAQLDWPEGGGIMLGDHKPGGEWVREPGQGGTYLVTDHVDDLYARAKAAGATFTRELADQDYGNREFAVVDPDGNLWSVGHYRGEPSAVTGRRSTHI